jgi:hypothetical protein
VLCGQQASTLSRADRPQSAYVLKKSGSSFYGQFSLASQVQLTRVRAMVAVLHSRVTDLSFQANTRTEFFNTISQEETLPNIATIQLRRHFFTNALDY